MKRTEVIEVGPVSTDFGRVSRTHHQVMELTSDSCLLEINLHVASGGDLLGPGFWIESDADQTIARQQPRTIGSGTALDILRNDAFFSIDPLDAIPRRCFLSRPLAKVEDARADQERCANEQEPGLGCDDRALHCYLNYAANSPESADPTLLSKVCSGHCFSVQPRCSLSLCGFFSPS